MHRSLIILLEKLIRSPRYDVKSSEAQKQQNDIEIEDFLEDYAWPGSGSEEGGDLSTDDELDKLMQSVGINDSGIGGSQGVYA